MIWTHYRRGARLLRVVVRGNKVVKGEGEFVKIVVLQQDLRCDHPECALRRAREENAALPYVVCARRGLREGDCPEPL